MINDESTEAPSSEEDKKDPIATLAKEIKKLRKKIKKLRRSIRGMK